jgi:hypothetical protein
MDASGILDHAPTKVSRAKLVDITGHEYHILDVDLHHEDWFYPHSPGHFRGHYGVYTVPGYLQIAPEKAPQRVIWIHFALISTVAFEHGDNGMVATVTLNDGRTLVGRTQRLRLSCKVDGPEKLKLPSKPERWGIVSYEVDKVKSIEFLAFSARMADKEIIVDRMGASLAWRAERETQKASGSWTIIDGDSQIAAEGVAFIDGYYMVWTHPLSFRGWIRVGSDFADRLQVQKEAAEATVPLKDLQRIEFTGERGQGNKPNAVLTTKDGSRSAVTVLFWNRRLDHGPLRPTSIGYGSFDEDDMLVWHAPYGYEGISLAPLRKLTITRTTEAD